MTLGDLLRLKLPNPFPFTRGGRQTLVYLVFAGAGPALTLLVWWTLKVARDIKQYGTFANIAYVVAASLLIIVTGLAMFVSIRALKIGKDGLEATGDNGDDAVTTVTATATAEVKGPTP